MQVQVLFFGILKDLAGHASESVSMPEHSSLRDLIEVYEERIPRLKQWIGSIAVSVNQEYASPETKLKSGDEVALLPPVSGGTEVHADKTFSESTGRRCSIVREKIKTHEILETVKRPEDGAAVLFDGVVRDNTRGRRTLFLEYEAYRDMALKQLEELAEQAIVKFQVRDVAIVHRLGRLEIGETSVLIVVASAHRAPAFEACRWLIDTLKRTVPIWKKEYFEDGAVWADGEPFPSEILRVSGTSFGGPASK